MSKDNSDLKVLIVDDINTNVILLKSILKNESYILESAFNGEDALKLVETFQPDLILLDIMMPLMDGYEVARRIRSDSKNDNIAIIFITALNTTEDIVKGFNAGGNDYISKPFIPAELKTRINHQLAMILARKEVLKQTEELRRNIEWRDRLYSVIAHDLRDPIGTIRMLLSMLLDTTVTNNHEDSFLIENLQLANDSAEEMFNLLDNLLKWTKSQIGNNDLVIQNFYVEDIIKGIIALFESTLLLKNISIEYSAPTEKGFVSADYDMINTVLRNLVNNAIKFSHPGGKIVISSTLDDQFVTISVQDFGVGIKEEDKHKILNNKVDFTSKGTNNEVGNGMGLMLCFYFVEKNGGKMSFESEYGKGTTFQFTIPLVKQ